MVCSLRLVLHHGNLFNLVERQFSARARVPIDDNIREEILRPEWIAGETGYVSKCSLYRMFADKGLVVAQYIRNRRPIFCRCDSPCRR